MKLLERSRNTRLQRLKAELALVEEQLAAREADPLFLISTEEQDLFIQQKQEYVSRCRAAYEREKNIATIRLGIETEDGHWTPGFKKAVETQIGATEEEMDAGYSLRNRFYVVLQSIKDNLVEKDGLVIAARETLERAGKMYFEAEERLRQIKAGNQSLKDRREKVKSDIDFVLYLLMESKKEKVNQRIRKLREEKTKFVWKSPADEQAESEARVLFGGEKE